MYLMRHRVKRQTMGKEPRIMSRSVLQDINAGSLAFQPIIESFTTASAAGAGLAFAQADTASEIAPNTIVKYVNIKFETGLRDTAPAAPGFMEYAVIFIDKATSAYSIPGAFTSAFSTQTVGDIARNFYRGDCIWYDSFPISREIPQVVTCKIKLPDKACKYRRGSTLVLIMGHHGLNVADTTTDARTFLTLGYKAYT